MWLLKGPFDTKEEAASESKFKLLKAGVPYTLTRVENHPAPCLRVNSKSVSKDHAKIQVVKHSEDDVTRPDVVPVLKITNRRDTKAITIRRSGEDLQLQGMTDMALHSGDFVVLGRKGITPVWQPAVLFWKPSSKELSPATKICASIGMKLSLTFAPVITHHVTANMELADTHIAALLAGAAPVTKAWIDRVFELAQFPTDGLEDTFLLPDPADYRPPFQTADAPWAQDASWRTDDNAEREDLLDGTRFLIVSDGPASPMFCENIARCGGGYDVLDVRDAGPDAAAKWNKTIAASKKRAGASKGVLHSALVVAIDEENIKPALTRAWGSLVACLHEAGLKYISSDMVRIAILDRKLKELDCFYDPAVAPEPEPEQEDAYIAGTLDEEPSQLAPSTLSTAPSARQKTALKRGAAPAVDEQNLEANVPKRVPRRTLRSASQQPEPEPAPPPPPPVAKRRAGGGSAAPEPPPQPVPEPEPEPAPPVEEEEDIFAPPKRALRSRRTRLASRELDADGDTSIATTVPSQSQDTQLELDAAPPRPPPRPSKRRAGGFSLKIGDDDDDESIPASTGEEPPLKKFKALFEGTEEGWSSKENESFVDLLNSSSSQSQSQPQSQAGTQSRSKSQSQAKTQTLRNGRSQGLTALMEVDEEVSQVSRELPVTGTTASSTATASTAKRKRDNDVEMGESQPSSKRRKDTATVPEESQAASSLNGVVAKGTGKTGAVGGVLRAPDANEKVLTALASLKRGKRTEDAFDREFNALRIARPESAGERAAREEDELFAHFDFDAELKGKRCFEVREYVLPERTANRAARREEAAGGSRRGPLGEWRPQWEGAPDFKKFRKVVAGLGRLDLNERSSSPAHAGKAKIELVCPETKDFGMGSAYWSNPSTSQSQSRSQEDQTFAATQQPRRFLADFGASDSDEPKPVVPAPKARAGRSQASQPAKKASQAAKKKTPLFIDDDDDEVGMEVDQDAPSTLAATLTQGRGAARSAAASSRSRKPVVEESDSDDGMTFRRKKTSSRR
ncbi:hypothetical protein AURDEDRAFT_187815 [Auricularia subglabra TFB-10046 SS5]|nr:hypothetical protein AURDEDRAFT_187815 [Auricularia subglabra TFB-10046 SS5]